ncbi:MAG TPA: choice-of-anchor Q domain-containing protein [Verrucomicrobiae bacterium]|nr:choice-of-anchor Q domain-containing protein [Verrucomicrobiae bacterium]
MKTSHALLAAALLIILNLDVSAATLYVSLNSTNPIAPYSDWSTAATNIQNAIDASANGDLILVTNGDYQNGIVTTNAITIQSVNGSGATFIDGNQASACAKLADGSTLIGFTLTNGYSMSAGAGVYCASTNVFLFNCLVISNSVYGNYGAVYSGTLSNCTITCNISLYGDGVGAAFSVLNNCTLSGNTVPQRLSQGGGAGEGGGAFECTLNRCLLVGNQSAWGAGAAACILNNCLVANNYAINYFAPEGDAIGGGLFACYATNCTIVNNAVYFPKNTSPRGGGVYAGTLDNCIIYANKFYYYSLVYLDNYSGGTFNNCCTTPLPAAGGNNITNAPLFLNQSGGDYHLQSLSPCINSGNNAYVTGAVDFDGNPRIAGGTVDIGAYEYQTPVSRISYAWLQQYGLPINTNIDGADLDGTAFDVYQDWVAGLNPTNALSVLAMLPPVPTNSPAGLVVSWQSVSNRTYFLQASTNLGTQPAFTTIQSNLPGQAGTTSYTDTNAVGNGPFFYRVGVQQ